MNVYRIVLLSLVANLILGAFAGAETTKTCGQSSFTLLYSSNVMGEYAPCG